MTPTDNDNPQEVAGTGSLAPTAYESGKVRDVNEDSFNPLGNSVDMWEQAGKYFMDAGRTADIKPDDGIITAGAKRANNYYTGMSMAALTGAEAVYQSAASLISNVVLPGMSDEEEKRLQRDLSGMPDAFLGKANMGRVDALGDAAENAFKGVRAQGSELLDNMSTNTLGSNLGQAFTSKIPEGLSNRILKFSKIGENPNSSSKLPAFVDGLTIPERGMKGSNVLKALEAHPDIRLSSINIDSINKSKMYSKADLNELFEANQTVTDIQETSKFSAEQRQLGIGFFGKEKDYGSVAINVKADPPFKVKGRVHYDKNTAAHLRFSEVDSQYLPDKLNQFGDFNKALGLGPGKPRARMIVADELQSDNLRNQSFKTLDAKGKEKVINQEFNKTTNGRLSRNLSPGYYDSKPGDTSFFGYDPLAKGSDGAKETVSVYKEAMHEMRLAGVGSEYSGLEDFDKAGSKLFEKVRGDIFDGHTISENDLIHLTELRTRKEARDINLDDYSDTIESIVNEIDQKWTPTILREDTTEFTSTFDQLPNIGTANISAKQGDVSGAIEDYQGALAQELMFKHNQPDFISNDLVANYHKSKSDFLNSFQDSINKVDSKGLLSNYSTDPDFINDALRDYNILSKNSKSPELDRKFSNSPIAKVREIQDEGISLLIQNASKKDINFIVLPRVDAMYKARPEVNIEKDNMLNRLYDYTVPLKGFEETYPGIKVHRDVKAPYVVNSEKAQSILDKQGIDLGGQNVNIGGKEFNVRGETVDIIDITDFRKEYDGTSFRSFAKGGLVSKENEVNTVDEQMNKLIQSGGVAKYG